MKPSEVISRVSNSSVKRSPKLTIKIDGVYFPLEKFKKALDNFYNTLSEIDRETYPENTYSLEWSVTSVREGSICLTAEPSPVSEDIDPNRGDEVISCFKKGIAQIEKCAEVPYGFSTKALRSLKELTDLIDPEDFAEIVLSSEDWSFALNKNISDNIDNLTNKFYRYYDSIEGILESISLTKGMRINIRDEVSKSLVPCYFHDDNLFQKAREALGKRVLVFGLITQYFHGNKKNIKAEEIKILPSPSEAPSVSDIVNFLEGKRG